ncbi:MAG: sugar phosphate nucleotidyltransferase [Terriglobia bacterium]
MRGAVLAGGLGLRLHSLTRVTNKHLLPVYNQPMMFYPIQTLVNAGITTILIVTGGQNAGDFLRLLSNGKDFGLRHLHYTYQEGEGGIADAMRYVWPSTSRRAASSASFLATTSSRGTSTRRPSASVSRSAVPTSS